jgi:hypothetical protein
MAAIGVQLALFRTSLVIGGVFLFLIMPALLMAWLTRVVHLSWDTGRLVLIAWACFVCIFLPLATCFCAAYTEFPPPNFFWTLFVAVAMFAAPGACAALFYYLCLICVYDALDNSRGPASLKYRKQMPTTLPVDFETQLLGR